MKPNKPFVIELSIILEVDPNEASSPDEWGLREMFDSLEGVTLHDMAFQFLDVENEVIQ